ncbi:MAG: TetR/AcrR family transcriptional regulator [Actinomycetota bacterium]|nr:TetR/AcrR family transcriptional regulator [Actinomycetota bacterium]
MAKRAEYLGPERRRPLVLDAALAIFAEGGFADASMSAIADRAGVSKAVLYDCFPGGKQEIYFALLDRGEEIFVKHMMKVLSFTITLPLEDALREGLLAFLNYAEVNPLGFRLIFGEPGSSDPQIAKRATHARRAMVEKMGERTLQIMQAAGVELDRYADVYNRSIVAIAEELARWVLEEPDLPRQRMVDIVVRWLMNGFSHIIPGDVWKKPLPD